ncbi:MAG TPA: aminopeptidase P N-terminal domain-containing protein [Terriglobales bacterium]|nr:aminopeptidase P N-terminal domain-containing protein [Terriglobales bacterium]
MARLSVRRFLIALLFLSTTLAGAMERQPNADYRARRQALAAKTNGGVVVLFAPMENEGPNALYGFRQEDNFYYLTGLSAPDAALVISPAVEAKGEEPARPYVEILFLAARNTTQERWTGPKLGPENPRAREITGFDRVEPLDRMREELARILPSPRVTIYTDIREGGERSPSTSGIEFLWRSNAFPNYVGFRDVRPLVHALRLVKDAGEVGLIRKATDASMAAHRAVLHNMKPGMTEQQISALMQYEFLKRGCERPAYAPIVGSGFNGTVLHYSENSATLADGDLVVMDVGGEYSMYATDITRTLPTNGKFTARQREIYEIVLGAQQAAEKAFELGKTTLARSGENSLQKVAYDYINSHGKDKHGKPLGQYFIHGLGHSVGLNVHDPGYDGKPIPKGMVFTIEPGIYIPEENLGVRIEDMYYVDNDGKLVRLSAGLPRTVEEIEAEMAKRD